MNRQEIFTAFLDEHHTKLKSFARYRTWTKEESENLLQTSLYRVFKMFDDTRPLTVAYVYKTMIHVHINEWRRKERNSECVYVKVHDKPFTDDEPGCDFFADEDTLTPEQLCFGHMAYDDMIQMIESLPKPQNITVKLHLVNHLPYKEIAQIADIPMGTVKSSINRGRSKLMKLIGDQDVY